MSDPDPDAFICMDCGVQVLRLIALYANDQNLCFGCAWLRDHPDAPESVRKLLLGDTEETE